MRAVRQLRKELGTDHGMIGRVAEQLGIGTESLRSWVKQAEIDVGLKPGVTSADAAQIRELEQENRELRTGERDPAAGVGVFRPGGARPPVR